MAPERSGPAARSRWRRCCVDLEKLGARADASTRPSALLPAVAGEVARVREFLEVTLELAATRDPDATKVEQ